MTGQVEIVECELCKVSGRYPGDLRVHWAWYRDGRGVVPATRCIDVTACRQRLKAKGEAWPLHDQQSIEAEEHADRERIARRRLTERMTEMGVGEPEAVKP